jgi:hypothetical protein
LSYGKRGGWVKVKVEVKEGIIFRFGGLKFN